MALHPSKILVTCCGRPEEIDVDMVRVCSATWARGVHTQWCCQDDGNGHAELGFPDVGEADRFTQLVFDLERAWEDQRAAYEGRPTLEMPGIADWEWHVPKLRLPLTQRWCPILRIPHGELENLAAWLETSTRAPVINPVAEPCTVSDHAGLPMALAHRRQQALPRASRRTSGCRDRARHRLDGTACTRRR